MSRSWFARLLAYRLRAPERLLGASNSSVASAARRVSFARAQIENRHESCPITTSNRKNNFGDIDRLPENMERKPRIQLNIG
jgi:hypothetical protein